MLKLDPVVKLLVENTKLRSDQLHHSTQRKKAKRGPALGVTFEQAVKNDQLGVVLISGQPYKTLTRVQLGDVRSRLFTKLEKDRFGRGCADIPGIWS